MCSKAEERYYASVHRLSFSMPHPQIPGRVGLVGDCGACRFEILGEHCLIGDFDFL